MVKYENVQINISEGQKQKIRKALDTGDAVVIKLSHNDLHGNDNIALTNTQIKRIHKANENGKGTTIKLSKAQVKYNLKMEGGFLGMLAGLAARALPILTKTILPALGVGALHGLANTGIQKIMGDGLYLKKGGCICRIETDGKGLYLGPVNGNGLESCGNGLYMKQGSKIYDGKGLLLGPNSPFKNIPVLGMLL